MGSKLFQCVNAVTGQEPRLVGQFFRSNQIFPASMRYSLGLPVLLLRKYAQQIAVMKIEGAKACHFSGLLQIAMKPAPLWMRPVCPLRMALCQYPPADAFQGLFLAQIAAQLSAVLSAGCAQGNVFAHFDVVAHLFQVIKKLPLRH